MQYDTWKKRRTAASLLALVICISLLAGQALAQPTSENHERLRGWLERFPAADTDKDGILTIEEAKQFREKHRRGGQGQARRLRDKQSKQPPLPEPKFEDIAYGPHERNVLDVYCPGKSDEPVPLVLFIHGGGFTGGDKERLDPSILKECLENGMAVASINYRFITTDPFPTPLHDGARAVQFLRSKAKEYRIDPGRIAVFGGSAGGGMSMWIAFHDDLADPKSADPVARQSTRVACAGSIGGQSTYDPRIMVEWVGEIVTTHPSMLPLYGAESKEQMMDPPPELEAKYKECSAINHLTKDDPPLFMLYRETDEKTRGAAVHSIVFGQKVKEKMDDYGIDNLLCTSRNRDSEPRRDKRLPMVAFFMKHLGVDAASEENVK